MFNLCRIHANRVLDTHGEHKYYDIYIYIHNIFWGIILYIFGVYRDNGEENGNYYLGFRSWRCHKRTWFRVRGLGYSVLGFKEGV